MPLAFVNDKTKKIYRVVSFDKEKGEVTLVGDFDHPFTDKFDKEHFQRMGYELRNIEEVSQS